MLGTICIGTAARTSMLECRAKGASVRALGSQKNAQSFYAELKILEAGIGSIN